MNKFNNILQEVYAHGSNWPQVDRDTAVDSAKQAIIALVREGIPKKWDYYSAVTERKANKTRDKVVADFHAYLDKLGGESG